jgi:alpha-glucosidase
MAAPWWQSAVVYQVYPRSFADASGDGVGDLAGLARRLDHLVWLGVDAVWMSPIFRSPMADYGYDVADYCDIDALFGTVDDLDHLLAELHGRGMRLLLDLVPNHTSSEHPWFVESRSSRANPKRDWYVWRDPAAGGGPPNNWRADFTGGPAWTLDPATGQYYLHCFLPEQPDLDWSNPEVEEAMHGVVRFWLDRGIDGFRIDVVHLIGKDPALADDPPERAQWPHVVLNDHDSTHVLLRRLRRLVDSYSGDRVTVGEVVLSTRRVATYYGNGDELHLAFNFPPLRGDWTADQWRASIDRTHELLDPRDAWPTWVLGNHDVPRLRTRYGSDARARAAAVLLLTLRGTPFLYAGDELGLEDAVVRGSQVLDPGGRDGCRAPIPWDPEPPHGWDGATPWLPFPPHAGEKCAVVQRDDPSSTLWLHHDLLALRRECEALRSGSFAWLDAPDGVLVYERIADDDRCIVCVSFVSEPRDVDAQGTILVSSVAGRAGNQFDGRLLPDEAVVLAA